MRNLIATLVRRPVVVDEAHERFMAETTDADAATATWLNTPEGVAWQASPTYRPATALFPEWRD